MRLLPRTSQEGVQTADIIGICETCDAASLLKCCSEEKVVQRPLWYRSRFAGEFSSRARLTFLSKEYCYYAGPLS